MSPLESLKEQLSEDRVTFIQKMFWIGWKAKRRAMLRMVKESSSYMYVLESRVDERNRDIANLVAEIAQLRKVIEAGAPEVHTCINHFIRDLRGAGGSGSKPNHSVGGGAIRPGTGDTVSISFPAGPESGKGEG